MSHFYFFNPSLRWTLSIIHSIWFVLEGGGVHEDPLWLLDYIYLEYFDTNELLLLLPAQQKVSWSATCQLADRPAEQETEQEGRRLYSLQFLAYMYKRNWHLNNLDTNWSALAGDQPQNIISPGSVDHIQKRIRIRIQPKRAGSTDPDPDPAHWFV